jgi:hypothetical protein
MLSSMPDNPILHTHAAATAAAAKHAMLAI